MGLFASTVMSQKAEAERERELEASLEGGTRRAPGIFPIPDVRVAGAVEARGQYVTTRAAGAVPPAREA